MQLVRFLQLKKKDPKGGKKTAKTCRKNPTEYQLGTRKDAFGKAPLII